MAVEDGAVLGFLLGALNARLASPSSPSLRSHDPLQSVLQLYESLRKSRTTLNVQGAQLNRIFFHLPDGAEQRGRDEDLEIFDWDRGTTRWKWADVRYQTDLLGFDAVGDAEGRFEAWWRDQTQMEGDVLEAEKVEAGTNGQVLVAS
jgi:salicylate hydroxylase